MKFPLSAPNIKIQRAKRHLAEMEREIATFIASEPIKFNASVVNIDGQSQISFTSELNGVPEQISAIFGDIIHNLRTALDLMACEMVRAAGKSEKDVYFPFSESAEELDKMILKRKFNRAGNDAVDLLISLKPYRNGNLALRLIHDMDVQDKHRALIPQVLSVGSPIIQMWEDDGTINPRVIGDPSSPSEIKVLFPGEVGGQGRELIQTLHNLVELVESVVEAFRALANRSFDA